MSAARGRTYCLDSWAVLRFLERGSPAARRVRQVLRRGRPIMSWINLGEVYYTIHRAAGAAQADDTLRLLRPLLALDTVTNERVLAAARIEALHPLAYGDAFAIATAAAHGAVLLTGDPEMTGRSVGCRVEDLRRQRADVGPTRGGREAGEHCMSAVVEALSQNGLSGGTGHGPPVLRLDWEAAA